MTLPTAPASLRRLGLEHAQTNRRPDQVLTLTPKTLAVLLGEAIEQFATDRSRPRTEGERS